MTDQTQTTDIPEDKTPREQLFVLYYTTGAALWNGTKAARLAGYRFGPGWGVTYACQASGGPDGSSAARFACAMMARPPPSSSGPGRRPFKAVARVRIPLGARPARAG